MEHGQLYLGRRREELLEEAAVGDVETAERQRGKHKKNDTRAVEQQVDKCRPPGVGTTGQTGNDRHDARSDIGTHRQVDALVDADESGDDHRKRDGGHHGRTLDDGRENGTDQHEQQGIADAGQEGLDPVERGKRFHGSAHQFETHEQQAETGQDTAERFQVAFLGKQAHESAQSGEGGKDDTGGDGIIPAEHTQCDNLRRDGGTDIGAIDDGGGLCERDDSGIDKADGHDGRRTGTLDGSRSKRADSDAQQFTAGSFGEKFFQFVRTRRLQIRTHHLARNQENADLLPGCYKAV